MRHKLLVAAFLLLCAGSIFALTDSVNPTLLALPKKLSRGDVFLFGYPYSQ